MTLAVDIKHGLGDFRLDTHFSAGRGLTALFGRSGAGKTSLINVIAGLIRPDQGRVVVDDAILGVENIMRRLRSYRLEGSTRSTARIVLEASIEVRGPIFNATMIIILAVVPVLFLQGLAGAFFKPLIQSYALAIFASLIVAMTVTPALCLILLDGVALSGRESPLVVWMRHH